MGNIIEICPAVRFHCSLTQFFFDISLELFKLFRKQSTLQHFMDHSRSLPYIGNEHDFYSYPFDRAQFIGSIVPLLFQVKCVILKPQIEKLALNDCSVEK